MVMYGPVGVGVSEGSGVLLGVAVGTGVWVGDGVAVGGAPTTMVVSLLVLSLVCWANKTCPKLTTVNTGLRRMVPNPGQA